jgi:hypothetical protein
MPPLLLVIRNLGVRGHAPQDVMDAIDNVDDILKHVLEDFHL